MKVGLKSGLSDKDSVNTAGAMPVEHLASWPSLCGQWSEGAKLSGRTEAETFAAAVLSLERRWPWSGESEPAGAGGSS
ncbi:hypothetical protein B0G38_003364 [Arthrobacter sp. VKM Ac-2550]|nr:hypothetical protein [Arthrobacter sp. VKM Ac-2550]